MLLEGSCQMVERRSNWCRVQGRWLFLLLLLLLLLLIRLRRVGVYGLTVLHGEWSSTPSTSKKKRLRGVKGRCRHVATGGGGVHGIWDRDRRRGGVGARPFLGPWRGCHRGLGVGSPVVLQ